jgi:hypothetical protein
MTALLLALVFGSIGLGFVMYAKKAGEFLPAIIGTALMVVPYFFRSAWLLLIVCSVLTALPFILRDR